MSEQANPEGTSGADEGISPLAPEAYDEEPEGADAVDRVVRFPLRP